MEETTSIYDKRVAEQLMRLNKASAKQARAVAIWMEAAREVNAQLTVLHGMLSAVVRENVFSGRAPKPKEAIN